MFKNICLSLVSGVPPLLFRTTPLPQVSRFFHSHNVYRNIWQHVRYTVLQMPIKWLALECIRNRIYTHKSDVWSFGKCRTADIATTLSVSWYAHSYLTVFLREFKLRGLYLLSRLWSTDQDTWETYGRVWVKLGKVVNFVCSKNRLSFELKLQRSTKKSVKQKKIKNKIWYAQK